MEYLEIIYISFGWLLGIVGTLVMGMFSKVKKKREVEKIIKSELIGIKKRLSPLSSLIYPRYGKLDEEKFNWIRKNSDKIIYKEQLQELFDQGMGIKDIVKEFNNRGLKKNTTSYVKKINMVILDSNWKDITLMEHFFLEKILEIRFHTESLNEDIDSLRWHLKKTFSSDMTTDNHEIISSELEKKSLWIADQSVLIVNKINILLGTKKVTLCMKFKAVYFKLKENIFNNIKKFLVIFS